MCCIRICGKLCGREVDKFGGGLGLRRVRGGDERADEQRHDLSHRERTHHRGALRLLV